jgi:putative MATE family efflux protein
MLHGKLFKGILSFSIPLLFIGLIQQLFNAVDIIVLGELADTNAVAAVGATSTIIHLMVNIAYGVSSGAKIILARLMGEGEERRTRETVFTSIMTAVGLGFLVALIGIIFAPVFLRITSCPEEIFGGAAIYMTIYFACAPAIMLYNFGSNILQVSGDSQRPLYYMILSGVLNVVLNLLLCIVMENKVAAVAIATAASQVLGAALVMIRLLRMEGACRLRVKGSRFSGFAFRKLMSNGIPIGLTNSLYSLANLQIQSSINSFGPAAIAGNSAMVSLEGIESTVVSAPWSTAAGVFIGKNVGADNKKRVKRSFLYCFGISAVLSILFSLGVYAFSHELVSLYVDSEAAIGYAQIRMLYTTVPYIIASTNVLLTGTIQAFGYSIFTTVNSIISLFVFRVIWMQFIYPLNPTFHMLMLCFLVSWSLVLIVNLVFFFYVYYGKFKRDKIKKMGV